jgi:hypothetical protein
MLTAWIVQILFSQIGKHYVKYTVETFTLDKLTIADHIEYSLNKIVLHMQNFVEKSMEKLA